MKDKKIISIIILLLSVSSGIVFANLNNGQSFIDNLPPETEVQAGQPVKATHPEAFRNAILNLDMRA